MRPITAAQGVRCALSSFNTASRRLGATHTSRPPLVWASANRTRCAESTPSNRVNANAASRFWRLPPGMQSRSMRSNASREIAGMRPASSSAPTPLDLHIEPRCPSSPNPVTSVPARTRPRSARSAPGMFSRAMMAMVRRASAGGVNPRLIPVVTMPVPSGFVSRSQSPGRAPALVIMRRGWTRPVTERP